MKKNLLTAFIILVLGISAKSQFTDNFSDGNITANPAWTGNISDFIVNAAFQLQSANTVASSTFYISTPNTLATSAQWDFYAQFTFNPSGANYTDVFLTASASDLTAVTTTGYFVRIGNTDDEISLWRKDGIITVKIIDGANGTLNTGNNVMRIRVIRNAANQWSLSRDLSATGSTFVTEGTVTDNTFITSAFYGIVVRQSTASFFQRHFFDDISVSAYVPDVTPPQIISATALSNTAVDVLFNEPVDLTTSQQAGNYSVNNAVGFPATVVRDAVNTSLVHLTFSSPFPGSTNLTLTVNGVNDLSGNTLSNGTAVFSFFTPSQYDIVIDEIMADPTPVVGLPDAEWIELRNTSRFDINLQGWSLGKAAGNSGPMPSYILKADSFVVITTGSAVPALTPFSPVISVTSFPSLGNTGDLIYLKSPQGLIIHSVNYTDEWYKNELKKAGGWSLEMLDTGNPCSGMDNWMASTDPKGGTPGKKNSADRINADQLPPRLLRAYAPDSITIVLVFNESVDSVNASAITHYVISDGIGTAISAIPLSIEFNRVQLKIATPLLRNKIYTVTATGVTDCSGNSIGNSNNVRVGLYEHTDSLDLVINEILFNPDSDGSDYVEIYNRTSQILNLKNISIANRNTAGTIASITALSATDYLFFPGDFIVITEDAAAVKNNFIAQNIDAFIEVNSMPSYSDDKGSVILLNEQGNIIDEVNYTEKWHFKLISNNEGVALERIDYNGPSNSAENWHSAATSIGYGTPTYKNSQYRADAEVQGEINISPKIFSPDNDGNDDFATLNYTFPEPGYIGNITIFDASGRPVRYLQRNALNGITGFYRWDGLDERGRKLPVGLYIIYTEIFNLQGKTKKFKNTIVLARRP